MIVVKRGPLGAGVPGQLPTLTPPLNPVRTRCLIFLQLLTSVS